MNECLKDLKHATVVKFDVWSTLDSDLLSPEVTEHKKNKRNSVTSFHH